MAMMGEAAMVAIYDVEAGGEANHDDWHSHEHMHERVSIPGFLRGRRYVAEGVGIRCFVFYEVDSLDVLTSPAYLERLNNPTAWSTRTFPSFRNMTRTLCRTTVSVGLGIGGTMTYVPVTPEPGRAADLRAHLHDSLAVLVTRPGVVGGHLMEGDAQASCIPTRERELRGNTDAVADWLLLLEGYDDLLDRFHAGPLASETLRAMGAASVGAAAGYSLGAALAKADL